MELCKALRSILITSLSFVMETIAPKDPEIKAIEELGYEIFNEKAPRFHAHGAEQDLICLYVYKDPLVKKVILDVKLYCNKAIAEIIGKALHEVLVDEIGERLLTEYFIRPLLVPIPMTKKGLRERGWNQCLIFAEALKKYDTGNEFELMPEALIKIRTTADQVGKSRWERFENLKQCFRADPYVKGRNVIVIDDICTTGATLMEARRALQDGGARNVLCVAFAR
jgi:ComF family protein